MILSATNDIQLFNYEIYCVQIYIFYLIFENVLQKKIAPQEEETTGAMRQDA